MATLVYDAMSEEFVNFGNFGRGDSRDYFAGLEDVFCELAGE